MKLEALERWEKTRAELQNLSIHDVTDIKQAVNLTSQCLAEIKQKLLTHSFANNDEEIEFFKEVLPPILGKLMYFSMSLEILLHSPASNEDRIRYLQESIRRIENFRNRHSFFIAYLRNESSYLDNLYFLRNPSVQEHLAASFFITSDTSSITQGSWLYARHMANDELIPFIESKIKGTDSELSNTHDNDKHALTWTASKSDLIEWMYAIYASKVINGGRVSISMIADWLQSSFKIDLGNYYRVMQGIRQRKKNRTQFIDGVKGDFIRFMDDTDENPRF